MVNKIAYNLVNIYIKNIKSIYFIQHNTIIHIIVYFIIKNNKVWIYPEYVKNIYILTN